MNKIKTEITVARTFIDRCIKEHINNNFSAEDGAIAKLYCTELQFKVMDEYRSYLEAMDTCKNTPLQELYRL